MSLARFIPAWQSAEPRFIAAWAEETAPGVALTVEADIDSGNVDANQVVLTAADTPTPTVQVRTRSAAGKWRHFLFRVDSAAGKQPTFRVDESNREWADVSSVWRPLWTTDFETWNAFPSFTRSGDYLVFTDDAAFTDDSVYIASHPVFRVADSHTLAAALLADPAGAPSSVADASGVIATSPAEGDENGRSIGEHPIYGITLDWGGATTDGLRKRVAVMLCGVHSGEGIDGYGMIGFLNWVMYSISAEAQAFRSNFILHCYFNLTPNGRYGGHRRTNFRTDKDPNRVWGNVYQGWSLQEVTDVRDAILADVDLAAWDFTISFHGWLITKELLYHYTTDTDPAIESAYRAAFTSFEDATNNTDYSVLVDGTYGKWATGVGVTLAITAEHNQRGNSDPDRYKQIGSYHARAVQMLDADGVFVSAPSVEMTVDNTLAPDQITLEAIYPAHGGFTDLLVSGNTVTIRPGVMINGL